MGANLLVDSNIQKIRRVEKTFDHPSVSAGTTETNNVTVPGVKPGDIVFTFPPTHTADFGVGLPTVVTTADTVPILSINPDGSNAVDPGSGVWTFLVFSAEGDADQDGVA